MTMTFEKTPLFSGIETWERWGFSLCLKESEKLKRLLNGKGGHDEKN
jgi:hypothetical protein